MNPLLSLKGFLPLWLTVLDLLRAYMHADNSENLYEAIPESLKNMLLVMASAGVLQPDSYLWTPTWRAIDLFLPTLKSELFPEPKIPAQAPPSPPRSPSPPLSQSPTNQVTLNFADHQQGTYPKPIPPHQAPHEQSQQQQQCGSSPISQSPSSDSGSNHLSTSPRLQEFTIQQPATPVKIVMPSSLIDTKESLQVITLVNQQPPSVSSPVAVQPEAHVHNSTVREQHGENQQSYQIDYRHQIGLGNSTSPVKSQYAHLPQMQDFNKVPYTDPVNMAKQSNQVSCVT